MAQIEQCYENIAALLNAAPRNVAVVANATAGFTQALSTIDFKAGDAIVTSRCDYTSNQIQYLALKKRLGVQVLHAADLPEGGVDPDSLRDLVQQHRCRLVAISWVPTNSGLVQDVESVGRVCRELGIPYLIDACQAAGQIPMDVTQLGCDYLSFTARKFLRGPRGIGALYVSDRALQRGDYPLFVDMRGARWLAGDQFEIERTARRFEDWEFPYALVLGQGAAVRYAMEVGIDTAKLRSRQLATHARACLESIYSESSYLSGATATAVIVRTPIANGVQVLDRGREQCAIVTASIRGWHAADAVKRLAQRGINTSASLREYGIIDFDDRGLESAVRISPHYYNTMDEIEQLVAAVAELVSMRDHFQ